MKKCLGKTVSLFLITVILSGSLMGCQSISSDNSQPSSAVSDISESAESDSLTEEENTLSDPPFYSAAFMEHATQVEGQGGLFLINSPALAGKPYQYIHAYGSYLLCVLEDYKELEEEEYDPISTYQFDLYDPVTDKILYSASNDDFAGNWIQYQVLGEELILYDFEEEAILILNNHLNPIAQCDLTDSSVEIIYNLYPSATSGEYLVYSEINGKIYTLAFEGDDFHLTPFETNIKSLVLHGVSQNGSKLVTSHLLEPELTYDLSLRDFNHPKEGITIGTTPYFDGQIQEESYLYCQDSLRNIYQYGDFASNTTYILFPLGAYATLLEDNTFLVEYQSSYEGTEEVEESTISFRRFHPSGQCINEMTYTSSGYLLQPVMNPSLNCLFTFAKTMDSTQLMAWDLSFCANENAPKLTTYDNLEAAVAQYEAENPDEDVSTNENPIGYQLTEEEFHSLNEKALEIESNYGVEIYFASEVPSAINEFSLTPCHDVESIQQGLTLLDQIFACYPSNFFSQLCYGDLEDFCIYISGKITSNSEDALSEASGFVTHLNLNTVMVLDTELTWNWAYVVNHEIAHMIDNRLDYRFYQVEDSLFSEETWSTYNPDGFSYLYSYVDDGEMELYDLYPDYFIDSYGVTFPTEDRAEIFGAAFSQYLEGDGYDYIFEDASQIAIQNKLAYYCQCIREGFDTTGWPEITPWEEVLFSMN